MTPGKVYRTSKFEEKKSWKGFDFFKCANIQHLKMILNGRLSDQQLKVKIIVRKVGAKQGG